MPLFIVGHPRSGTKLLRGLLNRHPEIAIPEIETTFLPYWADHWPEYGDLSDRDIFHKFVDTVGGLPFFQYEKEYGNPIDEEQWFRNCRAFTVQGVFEALVRVAVGIGDTEIGYWGDKSPSYLTKTPVIKSLFPDAKIIHIVRDVRDCCLSNKKAFGKNIFRTAQRWTSEITKARDAFEMYSADVLELRYEDLLANAGKELRRVCEFLSLPFKKEMCTLLRPVEFRGDARHSASIVSSNTGKYLTEMSPRTLRRIESIAQPILDAYGYELANAVSYRPLRDWQMSVLKFLDALNLIRKSEAEKGGVVGAIRFHIRHHRIATDRSPNNR